MTSPIEPEGPYLDSSTNVIYNLLFCDNISLLKEWAEEPFTFPYDVLFSPESNLEKLQKVIDAPEIEPRLKIFAYHKMKAASTQPAKKELLGVIIEVGLENGLDVLASYANGTARYINQSGKMIIWENTIDDTANHLTRQLFTNSQQIVDQIGPWNNPRKPSPATGFTRITFLVSDDLYFGEAPTEVLFSDPLASPALSIATQLMQYLVEKSA